MVDYSILPDHMQGAAKRYVESGIRPGSFLTALLANDFMGAMGRADDENVRCLKQWAMWLYNEIPATAKGTYERVDQWCERGGLNGKADEHEAA